MKQLFIVLLVAIGFSLNAQSDTARKQIAVVAGGSFGGGVSIHQPNLPYHYGALMSEEKYYIDYTFYCSVLFKERIGFRITTGYLGGSTTQSSSIAEYAEAEFPGYHFLPQYNELHAGYHYRYVVPQATYRIGSEPFNATFSLGAGIGRIHTPHGTVILQKDGSNDFVQLTYHSQNMWNTHGQFDMEFAYMRQLSQHFFANVGLFATTVALMSSSEFHYTETDYQQTYTIQDGGHSGDLMMHFNAGIFLNFQWNKRESERAYYE